MRTRRSRFFVVLLHVVGVSHSSYYQWNVGNNVNNNTNNASSITPSSSSFSLVEPNPMTLQYIDFYEEILQINENRNQFDHHSTTHPKWKFWKRKRRKQPKELLHHDDSTLSTTTTTTNTPIWLQDPMDGLCLGPMGTFSECGDATLWYVTIQYNLPLSNKLQLLSGTPSSILMMDHSAVPVINNNNNSQKNHSHTNLDETSTMRIRQPTNTRIGLTFRVIDEDFVMSGITATTNKNMQQTHRRRRWRQQQQQQQQQPLDTTSAECLDADLNQLSVHVRQCHCHGGYIWQRKRQIRSSIWTVNTNGILQPFETINTDAQTKMKRKRSDSNVKDTAPYVSLCLTRNSTKAILANCETHNPIQFQFLRYYTVPVPTMTSTTYSKNTDRRRLKHDEKPQQPHQRPQHYESSRSDVLLDTKVSTREVTNAKEEVKAGPARHSAIHRDHPPLPVGPLMHPELKIASRLIFNEQSNKKRSTDNNKEKKIFKPSSFAVALSETNPFLIANKSKNIDGSSTGSPSKKKNTLKMIYPTAATSDDNTHHVKVSKLRRMQTHPYLNEAKDGIWTDPQTNLQYNTDLSHYLGRNREDHGRHTLSGFGIYRKGYVIKVYGIAYYVSKRDVLTDPALEPYATMTAEQLRLRPDFYEVLRTMRESSTLSRKAGYFDRTIMLKTNMQLSTETMRSSLEADWSYLTDEAKRTLVDSSMQEQVADDAMLEFIQSPDNPSRCSCSQVAPPEYKANPDCCARGTELVFTWTKANELEVRLNGRLMDIFPRPDIAEGIFYEYLRYDNPISPEFVDRVVDGFPFLLGPLAQIRGIHIGQSSSNKGPTNENAILNAMFGFRDFVMSQSMAMSEASKQSILDAADHVVNLSKVFTETAMDMAKEADRRRDLFVKHAVAAPEVLMKLMARDEDTIQYFVHWMSGQRPEPESVMMDSNAEESIVMPNYQLRRGPRGRTFGYPLSRWFGEDILHYSHLDEIEPMMIHPTINRAILTLVHLYLLLLFIVSFPGSYSTRTKILHRRYHHHHRESSIMDDSDSDTISEYDTNHSNISIVRIRENVGSKDDTAIDDEDIMDDDVDQVLRHYDQQLKNHPFSIPQKQFQTKCVEPPRIRNGTTLTNSVELPILQFTTRRRGGEYTTRTSNMSNSSSGGMKKKSFSYFL